MEPVNWLEVLVMLSSCGEWDFLGRYQFAGASLAGKESCPHMSTMSDADDSTAGAGTTGDVVVTSRSFGWRLHWLNLEMVGLIQPKW